MLGITGKKFRLLVQLDVWQRGRGGRIFQRKFKENNKKILFKENNKIVRLGNVIQLFQVLDCRADISKKESTI